MYICIYLFNKPSVVRIVWHRMLGWLVNNELKRICNKAAVAYFDVFYRNVPGENGRNHKQFMSGPPN